MSRRHRLRLSARANACLVTSPRYPPPIATEPPMTATPRLAFLASPAEEAQRALAQMTERYGEHAPEDADVLVALGGDGFMLQTLHRHAGLSKPVYGMKLGTVGF